MLRAYLRGLLKPDYPQGYRSIAREELIIHALECEQLAEDTLNYNSVHIALVSSLTNKKELLDDIYSKIKLSSSLNSFIFKPSMFTPKTKATDKSAKLYELLEHAGILKDEADTTDTGEE